ncbi:unnamed protein product [Effrenium voratum]|nr:unnamed protein product [Effrenium voratum]
MAESERGEQEEREERGEQHERGERREIDSPDLDEMKSRRRTLKAELKTCHLFLAGAWPRQKGSVLRQNQQRRLLRRSQPFAQAAPTERRTFRLRASSALFTFNSLALKRESWSDFLTWLATLEFVARFTATMEDSYHSAHEGRVYLHFFAEFNRPVDWTTLRPVIFGGITPNAQPTRARGPRTREAMDQGHFYCYAQKVGTLEVATSNYEPWIHYTVKGPWLDSQWSAHKLSYQTYLQYARSPQCQVRTGFIGRQRQVEAVQMHEERGRLLEQQAAAEVSLQRLKGDFKAPVLARCEPWASQCQEPKMRYKFLILRGGSQSGKSTLAKSLGDIFGLGKPFIQTVQDAEAADLKGFDRQQYGYILFDNINSMEFVLSQRALFQANCDVHQLAQSNTGIYSYAVWLFKIPIVGTVDMSATWDSREPWLAANMHEVLLDGPCYLPPAEP